VSHFQNNLTKLITVILIWRFTHDFYRILYCFYIFVQWSYSNFMRQCHQWRICQLCHGMGRPAEGGPPTSLHLFHNRATELELNILFQWRIHKFC